jgi:uncharacterized membrane-anchored protein
MNTGPSIAPEPLPTPAPEPPLGVARFVEARSLAPSPAFWFSMYAASALGTNLGDFLPKRMTMDLPTSFATIALICGLLIWGDRELGRRAEAFFWLAIVTLRAAATNVGDFLDFHLGLDPVLATVAFGAATLIAGNFTRVEAGGASPLIDFRYWGTMFLAGVFGTIGGDLLSHGIGLLPAAIILGVALLIVVRARGALFPTAIVGYWAIVLAERAAGTPIADFLAGGRGIALGLPMSMICAGAMMLAGLWFRSQGFARETRKTPTTPAFLDSRARWILMAFSVVGSGVMVAIYLHDNPRSPWLVLFYGTGLALNFLYLASREWSRLGSSRLGRLARLWLVAKRGDFDSWADAAEADLRRRAGEVPPAPAE